MDDTEPTDNLLIIQCDSGHLYGDLVACARYRIDDEREKAHLQRKPNHGVTHVLFIIHLPRREMGGNRESSSFVGFQGGSWISAHVDNIRAPSEEDLTLQEALSAPINELFYNMPFVVKSGSDESKKVKVKNTVSEDDEPEKEKEDMELEDLEELSGIKTEDVVPVNDDEEIKMTSVHEDLPEEVTFQQILQLQLYSSFFPAGCIYGGTIRQTSPPVLQVVLLYTSSCC